MAGLLSLSSYRRLTNLVMAHWELVNSTIAPDVLVLSVNYTLADFTADVAAFDAAILAMSVARNGVKLAASERDLAKVALRSRPAQFRAAVLTHLADTSYAQNLPTVPTLTASEGKFLAPMDEMAVLWARINALGGVAGFAPPLLLAQGYDLATFVGDVAALRTLYRALPDAERAQQLAQADRRGDGAVLRGRMVQYRVAVLARFGKTDARTLSLPRISPKYHPSKPPTEIGEPDAPGAEPG